MKLTSKTNRLGLAVGVLFLASIPARAGFMSLAGHTPENAGVHPEATNGLGGTVISDQTLSFSLASNPYGSGTGMFTPITICFRNSEQMVPWFFLARYLSVPGTTTGPCIGEPPAPPDDVAAAPFTLTGTLRSLIVNRGGFRDYYYQLTNTSTSPLSGQDIFRMTVVGFDPTDVLAVTYRTDGLAGISGAGAFAVGTKAPYSADRDVAGDGNVGFDFDPSRFINTNIGGPNSAPGNVDAGDISDFIVVQTSRLAAAFDGADAGELAFDLSPDFPPGRAIISGAGTMIVGAQAPVPEPGTSVLLALGLIGIGAARARR